jgi:hypothetical protein
MRNMPGFAVRAALLVLIAAVLVATQPAAAASAATGSGSYVLSATDPASASYAPTFTGNGELGVRVPATGQGYTGGTVPAQSELAGFYAQPTGAVQQRANIPTWSTLSFSDNGNRSRSRADPPATGSSRLTFIRAW